MVMIARKDLAENSKGSSRATDGDYILDAQVGYKLRIANQKHLEIFLREIPDVTPTQFSVLYRLGEVGETSQNKLGRLVSTDAATTKGVVSRLAKNQLVVIRKCTDDRRRLMISLTQAGTELLASLKAKAEMVTKMTTARLSPAEALKLNELLSKM